MNTGAAVTSLLALLLSVPAPGRAEAIDFGSDLWNLADGEITHRLGRDCLSGSAYLEGVDFENGVIEVDIAVDGSRSYPGIVFHMQSDGDYERFYVRPHRAGLYPDALQYTPVFNGIAGWQLYNGEGFTEGAEIPTDRWVHLKLEVLGTQARVYLDDAETPALTVHDLKHGVSHGSIGLTAPRNESACFSRFSFSADDGLSFDPPPVTERLSGTLTDWELSRAYPASKVDRDSYPHFFTIFGARWREVVSEPSGLVDIARQHGRSGRSPDLAFARTIVRSDEKQEVSLSFGYSDEIDLFLNGKKIFSGNSSYRHRDPSFLGIVGPFDRVNLTLEKGLNEIFLMVTETFGGWGFMARAEPELDPPIEAHTRLQKVWETPQQFLTPESVLHDPGRGVLYVSNFDVRFAASEEPTGYISRLTLDGATEDLKWVTGLKAPAGMAIHGDRLYVAERGFLAEIDLEQGGVVERYPIAGSDFLNDVIADDEGNVYLSDTRPSSPIDSRIYRFKDGEVEVWLDSEEISRANGLYIHDGLLIVGNTGDGSLKTVDLGTKAISKIASLGPGVVDGIRVDDQGNYLVSQWEGRTYIVSPGGAVTEILDTLHDGINSADFEFLREENLLIVPTFLDNRVIAYRLE